MSFPVCNSLKFWDRADVPVEVRAMNLENLFTKRVVTGAGATYL